MPNAMIGSRLNCQACHKLPGTDFKGEALIQATESTCIACHGEDYRRLFDQWLKEIGSYLQEADAALARVDQVVAEQTARGAAPAPGIAAVIERARTNLHLVRAGNGIHNKNYALELLDLSIRDLDQAMAALTAPR
jgi:hypothetical protein